MTPEEKRKYRWLKLLVYIAVYGYQYPVRLLFAIAFLVPGLIFEILTTAAARIYDFLREWIVECPVNIIFRRLGFFELHQKAAREERYKKAMQQD
jgi:hypothetical protein